MTVPLGLTSSVPSFVYSERRYFARDEGDGVWSLVCPICEKRRALRPPRFFVTVDEEGKMTVGEIIRCPTRDCGWVAWIRGGVARGEDIWGEEESH